jgi:hypothetical protein
MSQVVLVAIAAAIGNLLQGWDNSTIAGISHHLRLISVSDASGLILNLFSISLVMIEIAWNSNREFQRTNCMPNIGF